MQIASCNTANRACSLLYSYIKNYKQGEWLLPVNICPNVPLTFCLANVKFEFVDINPQTLYMDEEVCLKRLYDFKKKYSGILFVRTYGCLTDTSKFFAECKSIRPFLKIIDDRCLCIPERNPEFYNSDMLLYSTGHCKQIDLSGGGFAYYSSLESYDKDSNLMYDGTDEEILYKQAYADNLVLDTVPQGWLKLDSFLDYETYMQNIETHIEQRVYQREKLNAIYRENIPLGVQLSDEYNRWRFNIQVPFHLKNKVLQALFDNDLFASNHYHSANRLFDKELYPHSENLFASVINLFNDKYYTEDKAIRTSKIIKNILS